MYLAYAMGYVRARHIRDQAFEMDLFAWEEVHISKDADQAQGSRKAGKQRKEAAKHVSRETGDKEDRAAGKQRDQKGGNQQSRTAGKLCSRGVRQARGSGSRAWLGSAGWLVGSPRD